jgi:hypothetical protein
MPQKIENLHLVIEEMVKFWKKDVVLLGKEKEKENIKLKLIKEKPAGYVEKIIGIIEQQVKENKKEIRIEKKLRRDAKRVKKIFEDCIKNPSLKLDKALAETGLELDKEDTSLLNKLLELGRKRERNLKDQESKLEHLKSKRSIAEAEKDIIEENAILNEITEFWQKEKERLSKLGLIGEKAAGAEPGTAKALSRKPATAIIIIVILAIALGGGGLFVKNKFFPSEQQPLTPQQEYEAGMKAGIENLNDIVSNQLDGIKKAVTEIDAIKATTAEEYDNKISKYTDQIIKLENIKSSYDFQSSRAIKDSVKKAYEDEKNTIIGRIDKQYLSKLELIKNFIKIADGSDIAKRGNLYFIALGNLNNDLMGMFPATYGTGVPPNAAKAYKTEVSKLKAKITALNMTVE